MLSEEHIRREKQVAEGYKEYFAKRPELIQKRDGKASTFVDK